MDIHTTTVGESTRLQESKIWHMSVTVSGETLLLLCLASYRQMLLWGKAKMDFFTAVT